MESHCFFCLVPYDGSVSFDFFYPFFHIKAIAIGLNNIHHHRHLPTQLPYQIDPFQNQIINSFTPTTHTSTHN